MLISLSKGLFAQIDVEDAELVAPFCWCAMPTHSGNSRFYAYTKFGTKTVYMHRLVMGAKKGDITDHKDGNGLNNRRGNLRLTDSSGNNANSRLPPPSSGYRGVYLHDRRYVAQVYCKGVRKRVGYFDDPKDAARAYDLAARETYGVMAVLNFPEGL